MHTSPDVSSDVFLCIGYDPKCANKEVGDGGDSESKGKGRKQSTLPWAQLKTAEDDDKVK